MSSPPSTLPLDAHADAASGAFSLNQYPGPVLRAIVVPSDGEKHPGGNAAPQLPLGAKWKGPRCVEDLCGLLAPLRARANALCSVQPRAPRAPKPGGRGGAAAAGGDAAEQRATARKARILEGAAARLKFAHGEAPDLEAPDLAAAGGGGSGGGGGGGSGGGGGGGDASSLPHPTPLAFVAICTSSVSPLYLNPESDGSMGLSHYLGGDACSPEWMSLVPLASGEVALRTCHGAYVTACADGTIGASPSIGPLERFAVEAVKGGEKGVVTLQRAGGAYLGVVPNGQENDPEKGARMAVVWNRALALKTEHFTLRQREGPRSCVHVGVCPYFVTIGCKWGEGCPSNHPPELEGLHMEYEGGPPAAFASARQFLLDPKSRASYAHKMEGQHDKPRKGAFSGPAAPQPAAAPRPAAQRGSDATEEWLRVMRGEATLFWLAWSTLVAATERVGDLEGLPEPEAAAAQE